MFAPSELFSIRGRTALVTAGATGIARIWVDALLTAGTRTVPIGRLGRPDDGAILFLTGRGGAYATCAILPVDGGVGVRVAAAAPMFGGDE
jgi:NAD(P)-dependent dehydrogenase (short-subunit alcohol dehydrogenase family)